jgi:transposase
MPSQDSFVFGNAQMKSKRRVSLKKILSNINLSKAEEIFRSKYKYLPGKKGRPPLSPRGLFLSFIIMYLRMESYRDYHAFLEKHEFWKQHLGFNETPDIGNFSHFLKRIEKKTFEQLFASVVQQLLEQKFLNLHIVAIDGSIIPANMDDPEAGWGWDHIEEKYVYGYKIHAIVDINSELPIAIVVTEADVHDSTQFKPLYQKMKNYVTCFPTKFFIADKAYDASYIRKILQKDDIRPVIKAAHTPFEPQYPIWFYELYKKRTSVERFFSRFKDFLDLKKQRIYGRKNVELHCYVISMGMLLVGYFNQQSGFSPRSVKSFLRKYT